MIECYRGDLKAPHVFCTRLGGVSTGRYASLNCGLSGLDDPRHVAENRARAVCVIGGDPSRLLGVRQIHSARVIIASAPWPVGSGAEADAMVTDQPHLALGIVTADCAPVLFSDDTARIVGAAHAGWRGTLAGILEATVAMMRDRGARTVSAIIGPCIHQASYEVGSDLREAVTAKNPSHDRFFVAGTTDRWQFDLAGYAADRLAAIGVYAGILPHDTYADEQKFFSHRRRTHRAEGAGGHQISIIRTVA